MPRGLCFYSRCKNAELESFYRARTGEDVPKTKKRMTKKDLANELRKVDRRPWNHGKKSFRFQDLPPEMRNLVYRELLPVRSPNGVRESNESRCQPAILRSCKQLHTEAQSILYGDHQGEITIKARHDIQRSWGGVLARDTRVFSGPYSGEAANDNGHFSLLNIRSNWPAYLLKFERINVLVTMSLFNGRQLADLPTTIYAAINQELTGLVSFLSNSTALKALTLTVHRDGALDNEDALLSMVRPLTLLGTTASVDIVDIPKAIIKDQMLRGKASYPDKKHFFADFQEMHASVKEVESFMNNVDPKHNNLGVNPQSARMYQALSEVHGFVDSDIENKMRAMTAESKAFLPSGVIDKLGRLARKKAKEIKQEAAKKADELEAQRQKFIEMGKAAKEAAGTEKTAEDTSTKATEDTPTKTAGDTSTTAA